MIKTSHKKCNLFKTSIWFVCFLVAPLFSHSQTHPLYNIGREQFEQKHFDSAILTFDSIILQFPGNKEAYYNRGLSYFQLSKYSEAISDFDSCLKIDSDFKDAAMMKTLSLQNSGQKIKYEHLAEFISREWYYITAIFLLLAILVVIVIQNLKYRR